MARTTVIWSDATTSLSPYQLAAFEQPWAEPGSLSDVLYQLEAVLLAVTPFEEQEWLAQVQEELREFRMTLGLHSGNEEGADSFLADIDLVGPGQVRQGAKLCRDHAGLLAQARFLVLLIEKGGDRKIRFGHIRRRVESLVDELGNFQAQKTELLLDSLCTDLGTGD